MIKRDDLGIICQHDIYDSNYMDGGDSSRATGMMALANSIGDQALLEQFEFLQTGLLRRHPHQEQYCDTNNFTRDQLVQFMGGLNKACKQNTIGKSSIALARRIFWSHAKRGFFCQNTHDLKGNKKVWWKSRDPLPPSNIGQMIIVSELKWLYWLLPFCSMWLLIDILFTSYINKINDENNQIIALCDVYGKWALKLYCWMDSHWDLKLKIYWGLKQEDFRYQPEIAEYLIEYIKEQIK